MKVKVIGNGGAFDKISSSYLVNGCILIDCGDTAVQRLIDNGEAENVTDIFITHIHQDHVGGLEKFLYYRLIKNNWAKLNLTIHCYKDIETYYKTLAVSKNPKKIKELGRFHETIGESYQPFLFDILGYNWNSTMMVGKGENEVGVNKINVKHMNNAIPCFGFIFTNNEGNDRVLFTGDIDQPLDFVSKEMLDSGLTVFHDMGWTNIDIPKDKRLKFHPTEQEVFDKYGFHNNIIGTHTNHSLSYYKKAKVDKVYEI